MRPVWTSIEHCLLLGPVTLDLDHRLSDYAALIADLLHEPWHRKHEDLAQSLQRLGGPDEVEALARTAVTRYDYLAHDDSHALARKL